jgi:hypothetical protein
MSGASDNVDGHPVDDATEADSYSDVEDVTQIAEEDSTPFIEENGSVEKDGTPEDLNEDEQQVIRSVQELGIEYRGLKSSFIVFERRETQSTRSVLISTAIPRLSIPDLSRQLEHAITDYPTIFGFMVPAVGYSEMVLRVGGYGRFPTGPGIENVLRLGSDTPNCRHQGPMKQLPAVPFRWRFDRADTLVNPRLHITDSDGSTCIEISNGSPLGLLLYGRALSYRNDIPFAPTVKIDLGKSVDDKSIAEITENLIRSLIYELDVRNGVIIGTRTRPLPREVRGTARRRRSRTEKVRYPKIRIQREVSDLFNFASQASDNPPLAFLSYYQTLEYFIPAAVRQSALKRIRRELRDPTFDEDRDDCILRVVSATERSVNIPEASQLRTLVNEFVRKDRLEEFFRQEWGNYFTRKGPIQGVEAISLSSSANLSDQVADRIYQIRNRIVHAKDDPRYQEARVLLPQSQEAQALGPDIELVRLLATEAILGTQR